MGLVNFNPGLIKRFHIFSIPLKIFFIVFLNPLLSNWNFLGVKVICFWKLHLGLLQRSCNFIISHLLFKSHHAEFDIVEQWIFLHFPFFIKFSCRVNYLEKVCDFLRPQILQLPLITLTSFLVFGFNCFIYILIYRLTIMSSSNTPSVFHLITENFIREEVQSVQYQFFFLFRFKKQNLFIYYI